MASRTSLEQLKSPPFFTPAGLVYSVGTPEVPPGPEMLPFSFPSLFILLVAGHQRISQSQQEACVNRIFKCVLFQVRGHQCGLAKLKPEL